MRKGLSDFVVRDWLTGLEIHDLGRLTEISLEEFRQRYIEEMQTYFDNHSRPTIKCWECPEEITSPEDLVRRYGTNLHKKCFKAVYSREREKDSESSQRYFDLILSSLA